MSELIRILQAVAESPALASAVIAWLAWDLVKFLIQSLREAKKVKTDEASRLRDQLIEVNAQAQNQIRRTFEIISDLTNRLNEAVTEYHDLRKEVVQVLEAVDRCIRRYPETAAIFAPALSDLKQWRKRAEAGGVG